MSFRVEIEITPDADGVHCGECNVCSYPSVRVALGWPVHRSVHHMRCTEFIYDRTPACLAAEKERKERNP